MSGAQVLKPLGSVGSVYSYHSQSSGVVFAGRNGLDFIELRLGAVRIPEVSLRIREAQNILDQLEVERVDLLGSTITEDEAFYRNIKIKSLLAAIVQVGLYDRLLKTQRVPDVLIGNSNGDSALLVCAGQITFENMVKSSAALQTLAPRETSDAAKQLASGMPGSNVLPLGASGSNGFTVTTLMPGASAPLLPSASLPSLAGVSLTEYRAFVRAEDGGMVEIGQPVMDMKRLVTEVVEHQGVSRFINIGPAVAIPIAEYEAIAEMAGADEVTIIDSIDLDPMLNWFWKQMRPTFGLVN